MCDFGSVIPLDQLSADAGASVPAATPSSIPGWPAGVPAPAGRMLSHAELAQQQAGIRPGAPPPGKPSYDVERCESQCQGLR